MFYVLPLEDVEVAKYHPDVVEEGWRVIDSETEK